MIKVNKEFLLSDDSVNCYDYRLLTAGLQQERFNPSIGFLMHGREKGVAVKWTDLEVRDGAWYGKPMVNDELFPNLAKQIEEGFYNAASVGFIVALEWSDDPALKLEGQTGPTVTKWFPREVSIVDIPGNYNAVAQLYAEDGSVLRDLSANFKHNFMKQTTIEVKVLLDAGLSNLAADSTSEQVEKAIRELVAKASKYDATQKELTDLQAEMKTLKETVADEKVQSIIKQALADHKMTAAMSEKLKADYKGRPEDLQALVDTLPMQTTIASQLKGELPADIAGKGWKELYSENKLEMVKKNYPEYFAKIRKEYFEK